MPLWISILGIMWLEKPIFPVESVISARMGNNIYVET